MKLLTYTQGFWVSNEHQLQPTEQTMFIARFDMWNLTWYFTRYNWYDCKWLISKSNLYFWDRDGTTDTTRTFHFGTPTDFQKVTSFFALPMFIFIVCLLCFSSHQSQNIVELHYLKHSMHNIYHCLGMLHSHVDGKYWSCKCEIYEDKFWSLW